MCGCVCVCVCGGGGADGATAADAKRRHQEHDTRVTWVQLHGIWQQYMAECHILLPYTYICIQTVYRQVARAVLSAPMGGRWWRNRRSHRYLHAHGLSPPAAPVTGQHPSLQRLPPNCGARPRQRSHLQQEAAERRVVHVHHAVMPVMHAGREGGREGGQHSPRQGHADGETGGTCISKVDNHQLESAAGTHAYMCNRM